MLSAPRPDARCQGDPGSALLLMPAGILIVVVLAAIAVDLSHLQGAERRLRATAADAANDAVGAGVDDGALRTGGELRIDAAEADHVARLAMAVGWPDDVEPGSVQVVVDVGAGQVTVTASGTVRPIFGRALPGVADGTTVTVAATAELRAR